MNPPPQPNELTFGGSQEVVRSSTASQGPLGYRLFEAAVTKLTATEEGRQKYGDPDRGGTLEQAWRTYFFSGWPPRVCLLADHIQVFPKAISRVIVLTPANLLDSLVQLFKWEDNRPLSIFTYDGRTGHSVLLREADGDGRGFTFHDPWPGDSLLSKHQNNAGVDAQRVGNYWHVTTTDLAKVIVAAFVPPLAWDETTGQPGRVRLSELQSSQLWSFMHIGDVGHEPGKPGGFKVQLQNATLGLYGELEVTLTHRERVIWATWRIREDWLFSLSVGGFNLAALRIAALFLRAASPAVDRSRVEPMAQAIEQFRVDSTLDQHLSDPEYSNSDAGWAEQAYVSAGEDSDATMIMKGSALTIGTEQVGERTWRSISINSL